MYVLPLSITNGTTSADGEFVKPTLVFAGSIIANRSARIIKAEVGVASTKVLLSPKPDT